MADTWIDISVPLQTGMAHWPDDPEPILERTSEIERGDAANVTFLRISAHTGTHMDGPCHFLPGREGVDTFPLDIAVGRARVIALPNDCLAIDEAELAGQNLRPGERILFKTRNSADRWDYSDFKPDFTALTAKGAQVLADAGVRLVGIDYLSIGLFEKDIIETHRVLLSAGVWILEGLDLRNIEEGEYDLICLPLRIQGSDGAPARAILRPTASDNSAEVS